VYVRGNFISDHATHDAARRAALQVARHEPYVSNLAVCADCNGFGVLPCTVADGPIVTQTTRQCVACRGTGAA
jgi:hypothetical protein